MKTETDARNGKQIDMRKKNVKFSFHRKLS